MVDEAQVVLSYIVDDAVEFPCSGEMLLDSEGDFVHQRVKCTLAWMTLGE